MTIRPIELLRSREEAATTGLGINLVTMDPGVEKTGFAWWNDGCLTKAELLTNQEIIKYYYACWSAYRVTLIEKPRLYNGRAARGDGNDLITLAITVGQLIEKVENAYLVEPTVWKGNVPKKNAQGVNLIKERALNKLSKEELSDIKLPAASLEHNVWDAIGIGLWALGR